MADPKVAQRVVPRTYRVLRRGDLVEYILAALESTGSTVLYCSQSTSMPLYVALMTPAGERRGLMVYAFRMTQVETKNRASGELRGQIRYGSEASWLSDDHNIAFDVANVDTTLVLGVSPEHGLIVGLDPRLYDPLPMGISFYAQEAVVNRVAAQGFAVWERENHAGVRRAAPRAQDGLETLAAFGPDRLMAWADFSREAEALGLDQALRFRLAEQMLLRAAQHNRPRGAACIGETV